MNQESYDKLIGKIYDTCYDPSLWQEILDELVIITQSKTGVFIHRDEEVGGANLFASYGVGASWLSLYSEKFADNDPGYEFSARHRVGNIHTYHDTPEARKALESTDIYKEFYRPQDMFYFAAGILVKENSRLSALSLQRGQQAKNYSAEDLSLLNRISPHIQRALNLFRDVSHLKQIKQNYHRILDKIPQGILLFDEFGDVVYENPIARSILTINPDLKIRNKQLNCSVKETTKTIREAINEALLHGKQSTIAIFQTDTRWPLPLLIAPIEKAASDISSNLLPEARVIGFLSDPECSQQLDPEALKNLYNFSKSETEVAIMLANGLKASDISTIRETSMETTRSQIKNAFKKAGVSGQVDFLRILLNCPTINPFENSTYEV